MAMARPHRFPLLTAHLTLALVLTAGAAAADGSGTPANAPADPAVATPSPAPRPRRPRVMSDELAATLSVGMPKYSPPKPVEKKPAELVADAGDQDKPKNGIIRLPEYVVREKRPPVFQEKDLAGSERKADLGMRRYAGLNIGPFSYLNRPIALAMYQEQERLDDMAVLADDAQTARRAGDKDTAAYITKQSQETYIRRDFGSNFGLGPR